MASSISVVVTWQRVICAIDCARRWTAASLIGVGRSIPRDSCLPVCRWTKAFRYSTGVHSTAEVLPSVSKVAGGLEKLVLAS